MSSIQFELPYSFIEALRQAIRDEVGRALQPNSSGSSWLDVAGAAEHLNTSEDAIRALVKRGQIPVHRTPQGRLLFSPEELDAWVGDVTMSHF